MAYRGLPFPDTSWPVLDVYIYGVSVIINVWDTVSTFIHLQWCVSLVNFSIDFLSLWFYTLPKFCLVLFLYIFLL